jgi:hypothetical protein
MAMGDAPVALCRSLTRREGHHELRQFLRKASTTRSAKKSHEGFVRIATTILSLEILASSFAGWGSIYPEAGERAREILKRNGGGQHLPLMEFYLHPPKYVSSAALAALARPAERRASKADICGTSNPDISTEKQALNHAMAVRKTLDDKRPPAETASAG